MLEEDSNARVKKGIKMVATVALILVIVGSVTKATSVIMNNGYDTATELSKVDVGTDTDERLESIAVITSNQYLGRDGTDIGLVESSTSNKEVVNTYGHSTQVWGTYNSVEKAIEEARNTYSDLDEETVVRRSIILLSCDDSPYKDKILDASYVVEERATGYQIEYTFQNDEKLYIICLPLTFDTVSYLKDTEFSDEELDFYSMLGQFNAYEEDGKYVIHFR